MRGLARDLVRDALGRTGRTSRDLEILVDWSHDDAVLRRAHIGHEWSGPGAMGRPMPVAVRIRAGTPEARIAATVERFVGTAVALDDRQRAIAPHLDDDRHPAWSVLVDPCALALIRHARWKDEAVLGFHRPTAGRYTVGDGGYTVGTGLPSAAREDHLIEAPGMGLNAGVLTARRIRFGRGLGTGATYLGGRTPRLELHVDAPPQTVLEAMRGKPVSAVLDHPALRTCDAKVTSARMAKASGATPTLEIRLASRLVPMAPAPEGVDTDWMAALARR